MEILTLNQVLSFVGAAHLIAFVAQLNAWITPKADSGFRVYLRGGNILNISVIVQQDNLPADTEYGTDLYSAIVDMLRDAGFSPRGKNSHAWFIEFPLSLQTDSREAGVLATLYGCESVGELKELCVNLRKARSTVYKPRKHKLSTERMMQALLAHAARIWVGEHLNKDIVRGIDGAVTLAVTCARATEYGTDDGGKFEVIAVHTYEDDSDMANCLQQYTTIYTEATTSRVCGKMKTNIKLCSANHQYLAVWRNNIACPR